MASLRDQFFSSSPNSSFSTGIQYNNNNNSHSNSFEFDESEIWNSTPSSNDPEQFSNQINTAKGSSSSSFNRSSYQTIPIPINTSRLRKSATTTSNRKKVSDRHHQFSPPPSSNYIQPPTTSSSLPVNIPDWSKIMGRGGAAGHQYPGGGGWDQGGYYNNNSNNNGGGEEEEEEEDDWVAPHEYTARQLARRSGMMVAFSVHEGVGRTLKGRDLSRVRNAIWKQTGFED